MLYKRAAHASLFSRRATLLPLRQLACRGGCRINQTAVVGLQDTAPVLLDRRDAVRSILVLLLAEPSARMLSPGAAEAAAAQPSKVKPAVPVASDEDACPTFFRTTSGVKVQELLAGAGPTAKAGDRVLFDFVMRRRNGYFIYGTVEGVSFQPSDVPIGPVTFKLGDTKLIPGLQEVLIGMQPGGKRRALIPPEVGYAGHEDDAQPQPPTYATKRQLLNHANEPLMFEVQLLRVNEAGAPPVR